MPIIREKELPLEDAVLERLNVWLPKLSYPVRLLLNVRSGQALTQSFPCRLNEVGTWKSRDEAHEEPVPMYGRVPVVATVECGRQFSRRGDILIAV